MRHESVRELLERLPQLHAEVDALADRLRLVYEQVAALQQLKQRRELVFFVTVTYCRIVNVPLLDEKKISYCTKILDHLKYVIISGTKSLIII